MFVISEGMPCVTDSEKCKIIAQNIGLFLFLILLDVLAKEKGDKNDTTTSDKYGFRIGDCGTLLLASDHFQMTFPIKGNKIGNWLWHTRSVFLL